MSVPVAFISLLNPIRFVPADEVTSDKEHTVHFDRGLFYPLIRYEQRKVRYNQPVQQNQRVTVQIRTNLAGAGTSLTVLDCSGDVLATITPDFYEMPGDIYTGDQLVTCQASFLFSSLTLPDDIYYLEWNLLDLVNGNDLFYISEPIDVRVSHPNTILFKYTNDINDVEKGIVFLDPLNPKFQFRVEGTAARDMKTNSVKETYRNAAVNPVQLSSHAYRGWSLWIGGKYGVPPYMKEKVDLITGCSTWIVDGKQFSRDASAEWEDTDTNQYPLMRGILPIEEADREGDTRYTGKRIELFTIPSYPFAFAHLRLLNGGIFEILQNDAVVIEDLTGLNAWITATNSAIAVDVSGAISIGGSDVIYTSGPDEQWASSSIDLYDQYLAIDILADPTLNSDISVDLTGDATIIDPGDSSTVGWFSLGSLLTYVHTYAPATNYLMRIFHRDAITDFKCDSVTNTLVATNISQRVPRLLKTFNLVSADIGSMDFDIFQITNDTLTTFKWIGNNLTTPTGSIWNTTPKNFAGLLFISFAANNLSSTEVDNMIIAFEGQANYGFNGLFIIDDQTPAAPPTSASLTARTNLITAGWAIITD